MADIAFDDQVDITDKVCPLTFVKAGSDQNLYSSAAWLDDMVSMPSV